MGKVVSKVWDLFRGHSNFARRVSGGILGGSPWVPPAPKPPNLDTATQAVLDNQDQLARRKGVLGNVFAGSQQQNASIGKTILGG